MNMSYYIYTYLIMKIHFVIHILLSYIIMNISYEHIPFDSHKIAQQKQTVDSNLN